MSKKRVMQVITLFFIGIVCIVSYNKKHTDQELIDCDTVISDNSSKKVTNSEKKQKEIVKSADKEIVTDVIKDKIFVHICGHVKKPGVYELSSSARVIDAINAAEGLNKDADKEAVNQAKKLEDSEQIYIPSKKEVASEAKENIDSSSSDVNNSSGLSDKNSDYNNRTSKSVTSDSNINNQGKVNINTASETELITLPGIGSAKAKDIIAYREQNNGFKKIQDIMNISGIKEGLFNKISENITV